MHIYGEFIGQNSFGQKRLLYSRYGRHQKSAGKNEKGQQLTTIDAVGNYYISFDGKEILREVIDKNGNASYKNMDVKKVPTSKTANHVHEDETTKNNLSRTLCPCGIFLALAY